MIYVGKKLTLEDYKDFNHLLDKTVKLLLDDNNKKSNATIGWQKFEIATRDAIERIQKQNSSEKFSKWDLKLISGAKFPDIILELKNNQKFGVEVKTVKSNIWKTLGGSIMESTKIPGVERINILFAKSDPFEVRHKSFEDCISDVAVTHSPRYMIDFNLGPGESIFNKIGVPYDEITQSQAPYNYFKNYFKSKASKNGLWFIDEVDTRDPDDIPRLKIQFFSELPSARRADLTARAMILFPEIFAAIADYRNVGIWLANMGIINTSLRDIFSAGENSNVLGYRVPSKYKRLNENGDLIKFFFRSSLHSNEILEKYEVDSISKAVSIWSKTILSSTPSDHKKCVEAIFKSNSFIK